jgi:hypothetical protein
LLVAVGLLQKHLKPSRSCGGVLNVHCGRHLLSLRRYCAKDVAAHARKAAVRTSVALRRTQLAVALRPDGLPPALPRRWSGAKLVRRIAATLADGAARLRATASPAQAAGEAPSGVHGEQQANWRMLCVCVSDVLQVFRVDVAKVDLDVSILRMLIPNATFDY